MGEYNVNQSYEYQLRAAVQQTETGLLWTPPTYYNRTVSATSTSRAQVNHGARVLRYELNNRSGSTAIVGLGFRFANQYWRAGTYNGTTFTDDTADLQDTGTGDFSMGTDTTTDSVVILCGRRFDWVSIQISTAEVDAGGAVDHTVTFSNQAGTGWTTLGTNQAAADSFTRTNQVWPTGELILAWKAPSNWGKVTSITGIPDGYYALRLTTADNGAGDTAALATAGEIGSFVNIFESLADNSVYEEENVNIYEPYADGLVAYFGTANAGNYVKAEVENY